MPHNRPPVLVIVQDDAKEFNLLKRALWKSGATARVWWAQGSDDALGIIGSLDVSAAPVCVVADIYRAGFDGFELLKEVKRRVGSPPIRFAFLTSHENLSSEARALAAGADAFLVKPPDDQPWNDTARALQRVAAGSPA